MAPRTATTTPTTSRIGRMAAPAARLKRPHHQADRHPQQLEEEAERQEYGPENDLEDQKDDADHGQRPPDRR